MKRLICLMLCLAALCGLFALPAAAAPDTEALGIDAKAALLIDLDTGTELYALNADEVLYPASLTKILTAIVAIERGNLEDVVTVNQSALEDLDPDGTTVWLAPGEQMSLKDLLYCMLLSSANDACNVVAEHIAGSVDDFVDLMNDKAKDLGCRHTHFTNTNGLPDENHTTTARDLATIAQYAIQDPTFWEICTTTAYTVPATNSFDARQIATTNAMTTTNKYYYYYDSRVQGVKTGYTNAAGRCLIVTAQEDGHRLLSVVLGAPDTMLHNNVSWLGHYADTALMLDYGFELLEAGSPEAASTEDTAEEQTGEPEELPETTEAGAEALTLEAPAEDEDLDIALPETMNESEGTQTAPEETPSSEAAQPQDGLVDLEQSDTEEAKKDKGHFPWLLAIVLVFAILIEACIVYILLYRYQYRRRRQQRLAAGAPQSAASEPEQTPAE